MRAVDLPDHTRPGDLQDIPAAPPRQAEEDQRGRHHRTRRSGPRGRLLRHRRDRLRVRRLGRQEASSVGEQAGARRPGVCVADPRPGHHHGGSHTLANTDPDGDAITPTSPYQPGAATYHQRTPHHHQSTHHHGAHNPAGRHPGRVLQTGRCAWPHLDGQADEVQNVGHRFAAAVAGRLTSGMRKPRCQLGAGASLCLRLPEVTTTTEARCPAPAQGRNTASAHPSRPAGRKGSRRHTTAQPRSTSCPAGRDTRWRSRRVAAPPA